MTRLLKDETLTIEEILEILNAEWLYELLPGDGQDDYILQKLREAFVHKAMEK